MVGSTSSTNLVKPFWTSSIYVKAQSRESDKNLIKFSLCISLLINSWFALVDSTSWLSLKFSKNNSAEVKLSFLNLDNITFGC